VKPEDQSHLADALHTNVKRAIDTIELQKQQYQHAIESASDPYHNYMVFNATVDFQAVAEFCTILRMLGRKNPGQPLTVEFRTPGGDVDEGMRMYDEILRFKAECAPITMRVRASACSMGAVLLQAATTREIGPNARLMIHRIGFGAQGQAHEVEDEMHNAEEQEKRLIQLFSHRSTLSEKQWMTKIKKARRDLYFNAQEALELGLVDAIR